MFDIFNFDDGEDLYNPCEYDPTLPFDQLEFILTEDMFQVSYEISNSEYVIDVGWYPEGNENGKYKIVLIKNFKWQEPVICKRTKDYKELERYMGEILDYIKELKQAPADIPK